MTIELRLKEYILDQYKSIREFSQAVDIPYTTIDSILRRGVGNSSITNVIKICEALKISADELANDRITPISLKNNIGTTEILDIISEVKTKLSHYDGLTLEGEIVSEDAINAILSSIDIGLEMGKKYNKKG